MEKTFSKVKSDYLFHAQWTNSKEEEQTVTVKLSIDFTNRTFSILPERNSNDKFSFIQGNRNSSMLWLAIAETMIEANKLACKKLKFI